MLAGHCSANDREISGKQGQMLQLVFRPKHKLHSLVLTGPDRLDPAIH
jgi:hypothetical protein